MFVFFVIHKIQEKSTRPLKQYNLDVYLKQMPQLPFILYILDLGITGNRIFTLIQSIQEMTVLHVIKKSDQNT